MSFRSVCGWLALTVLALSGVSCGGGKEEGGSATQTATSAAPAYTATGNEGGVSGAVSFTGAAPTPRKISMDADPVCKASGEAVFEDVVVNNGKLQNVFVYVKGGLPNNSFAPQSAEVLLDQKGCRYVPHVLGLHTAAALKISTSDQTNHNVHPAPKVNREWNETMFPSQAPLTKKFAKPEVVIPVKCNLHAWMLAYVGVLDHPFFAVSGADGAFAIKGLPPGEYELEAWHEKYGARQMKVKVEPKGEAKADFAYSAATAYQAGSLKMQPALVLP